MSIPLLKVTFEYLDRRTFALNFNLAGYGRQKQMHWLLPLQMSVYPADYKKLLIHLEKPEPLYVLIIIHADNQKVITRKDFFDIFINRFKA